MILGTTNDHNVSNGIVKWCEGNCANFISPPWRFYYYSVHAAEGSETDLRLSRQKQVTKRFDLHLSTGIPRRCTRPTGDDCVLIAERTSPQRPQRAPGNQSGSFLLSNEIGLARCELRCGKLTREISQRDVRSAR